MSATFRQLAAKMGLRASDLADAEPWDQGAIDRYAERHGKRSDLNGYPHLPDIQVASAVRMLMRDDLDHETVVCAARDRICALHLERAALASALHELWLRAACGTEEQRLAAMTAAGDLLARLGVLGDAEPAQSVSPAQEGRE